MLNQIATTLVYLATRALLFFLAYNGTELYLAFNLPYLTFIQCFAFILILHLIASARPSRAHVINIKND